MVSLSDCEIERVKYPQRFKIDAPKPVTRRRKRKSRPLAYLKKIERRIERKRTAADVRREKCKKRLLRTWNRAARIWLIARNKGPQTVYVFGDGSGEIKIGISDCPEQRLLAIQSARGRRLSIEYLRKPDDVAAIFIEKITHWLLRERRLVGEWFRAEVGEAVQAIREAEKIIRDGKISETGCFAKEDAWVNMARRDGEKKTRSDFSSCEVDENCSPILVLFNYKRVAYWDDGR